MRKLMWFTIGFGAVCAFCSYCYVDWMLWACLVGMILCVGFAFAARKLSHMAVVSLITLGISIGFGWFWVQDSAYLADARRIDGKTVYTDVTVTDYAYSTQYGTAVDGQIILNDKDYRVRVYLEENMVVAPGAVISGAYSARFTANGGAKDPTSHRSEGILLLLYQRSKPSVQEAERISWSLYPAIWRQMLLERIEAVFPGDTAGFAKALLLGDRSDIDYETNTALKVSGISHVVAVSGLHVSILFGLLYTLTLHRRWLTGLVGIPAMILFAAIVGFTPSVTRACVMQILMMLALMTDREYDPPTALAFAVLVMLAVNPMTVTSVSFQLSVACMIGIFLFSGRIRAWLEDERRLGSSAGKGFVPKMKRWLLSSVSVTVSASVITTPLVAFYFGTVSLISVLTNLLTLWVISFAFYGIILAGALSFLSTGFAAVIAWIISWPIRYVILTAKILTGFPMAAVYTESIYIVIWLIGCYGMLAAFLICKQKYPVVFGCCAAISLCIAMLLSWYEPLTDDLRVSVLDVGQGQCILLQSEGRTYMVDCGGDSDTIAADKAAEHLLSQGIDHLDGIILTHYDKDHAGGVENLLKRVDADALYIPDSADPAADRYQELPVKQIHLIKEDSKLRIGQTVLTIYAPETANLDNESGLCVLFQRENCDILITGDRGELGETLRLHRTDLPDLELLIAGHHGSASSTGEDLLAKTTPDTVIVSVGANNYYGHPSSALLDRLAKFGCVVYRTDENGTVIYRR